MQLRLVRRALIVTALVIVSLYGLGITMNIAGRTVLIFQHKVSKNELRIEMSPSSSALYARAKLEAQGFRCKEKPASGESGRIYDCIGPTINWSNPFVGVYQYNNEIIDTYFQCPFTSHGSRTPPPCLINFIPRFRLALTSTALRLVLPADTEKYHKKVTLLFDKSGLIAAHRLKAVTIHEYPSLHDSLGCGSHDLTPFKREIMALLDIDNSDFVVSTPRAECFDMVRVDNRAILAATVAEREQRLAERERRQNMPDPSQPIVEGEGYLTFQNQNGSTVQINLMSAKTVGNFVFDTESSPTRSKLSPQGDRILFYGLNYTDHNDAWYVYDLNLQTLYKIGAPDRFNGQVEWLDEGRITTGLYRTCLAAYVECSDPIMEYISISKDQPWILKIR